MAAIGSADPQGAREFLPDLEVEIVRHHAKGFLVFWGHRRREILIDSEITNVLRGRSRPCLGWSAERGDHHRGRARLRAKANATGAEPWRSNRIDEEADRHAAAPPFRSLLFHRVPCTK
jgi:hypothetical protein